MVIIQACEISLFHMCAQADLSALVVRSIRPCLHQRIHAFCLRQDMRIKVFHSYLLTLSFSHEFPGVHKVTPVISDVEILTNKNEGLIYRKSLNIYYRMKNS